MVALVLAAPASEMVGRMRRGAVALVLALGVVVSVLVSGCGGSSTASRLQSRLLSVADLPAGWSSVAVSTSSVKVTDTSCLAHLAKSPKGWSHQTAAFVEGKSIPNLGEVLATGAQVGQAWDRFAAALASCRSALLQLGNTKVQATVHRLAFPRLGRASSAYGWAVQRTPASVTTQGKRGGNRYGGSSPRAGRARTRSRRALKSARSPSMTDVPGRDLWWGRLSLLT